MTYGKTNKKNKAPKIVNAHPNQNYMKVAGIGMKKAQGLPLKQKRLSK